MVDKQERFLDKAYAVHGDKYDYSKVEYINASTKICIICPEHGEFWQTPMAHLRGHGCPKCGKKNKGGIIHVTCTRNVPWKCTGENMITAKPWQMIVWLITALFAPNTVNFGKVGIRISTTNKAVRNAMDMDARWKKLNMICLSPMAENIYASKRR